MWSALVISATAGMEAQVREGFPPDHRIDTAGSIDSALKTIEKRRYDILFIDIGLLSKALRGNSFKETFHPFKALYPSLEIVVISPQDMVRQAVMAVKSGASDYLTYPIAPEEVRLVIESINESILQRSELDYLRDQFWRSDIRDVFYTENPAMKTVFKMIESVAPTKTTVLLVGETGTGKGVLARLIHQQSRREHAQFISVHCGSIPDTLLESELFGHEKGAFTSAVRRKLGKFEIAKGGTIFLDEIGTITPPAQIKLLQVLQDRTFSRVGGEGTIETDARVIAATNSNLKQMSEEGRFRKDLYYRLNVFPIEIPPLRDRIEDIEGFIQFFLKKLNLAYQKNIRDVHPEVVQAFQRYDWPGNIRELENLIERAYILENSAVLTPEGFPGELFDLPKHTAAPVNSAAALAEARRKVVEEFERRYLKDLILRNRGRINASAAEAGVTTRQLHKLMSKYGIRKEEFKP